MIILTEGFFGRKDSRSIRSFFLVFASAFMFFASGFAATITGRVTVDGVGTEGFTVSAFPSAITGTTGANGAFSIEVPDNATYYLSAAKSGSSHVGHTTTVAVTTGTTEISDLKKLTPTRTISGIVPPLIGGNRENMSISASVSLSGVSYYSSGGSFDPITGEYSVDVVDGDWQLTVYKRTGETQNYSTNMFYAPRSVSVSGSNVTNADFLAETLGTITGTVTVDGVGEAGLSVVVHSWVGKGSVGGTTGANGAFSIAVVDGTYAVVPSKTGCIGAQGTVTVTGGSGAISNPIKLLTPTRTISGMVALPATGTKPSYVTASAMVDGAWLSVGSLAGSPVDPNTGAYTLSVVPGNWSVQINKATGSDARYAQRSVPVEANSVSGIDFSLAAMGVITGTVTVDGEGASGVSVFASPSGGGTSATGISGVNGAFSIDVSDNQTYFVYAGSSTALAGSSQSVSVTSGTGSLSAPITLLTKVTVSGTVTLPSTGTKPSYVTASATIGGVSYFVGSSFSEGLINPTTGAYTFGLAAGNWTLQIRTSTHGNDTNYATKNITVSSVAQTGVDFAPEIAVSRLGGVSDGGIDSVVGTILGQGSQLSYAIANGGSGPLELTVPVTVSGESNCGVVVNTQPDASKLPGTTTSLVLTVTPSAAGVWSFTVSIPTNDADENPFQWTVSGTAAHPVGSFGGWAATKGLSGEGAGIAADSDGDGIPNFMEFALNASPTSADGSKLPVGTMNGTQMVLRYRKNKGASGLVYVVESSPDMVLWTEEGSGTKDVDADGETEEWVFSKEASGNKLFLRLRVRDAN